MRYFIDTEFIEDGKTIELISIGIVAEDGRELYLISKEYKYKKADDWVKENVILPMYRQQSPTQKQFTEPKNFHKYNGVSREHIKLEIDRFIGADRNPQFFAYYADYDWVAFCQLFGRMIDLPRHFPMFCIDLKQMMWERGLTKENFNVKELLPQENEHDALADAQWNKLLYDAIISNPLPLEE